MARARKGTVVDERYALKDKVGTGGMADVWLAHDNELDRDVAIKMLHDRFAQDNEFVERFKREAQSAAGLQHPNVVSIFDRGAFRDTYFIAMEYVDGPQLKELVKGGMSSKDAIDFTRQILNAARFAHRKGIIHRDLKPQNVMIDEDGRARVADFGIARAGASDITGTGSVMGTAQYLSPEQAQGKETTERSDIYSIGVILYEALTGRVPFEGDSAVAVALKQVSEQPRRPSAVNPKVPPALDAVVMRALAKDPEARFINADAFLKALDAAELAPDQPRPEDTAAFAAVAPDGTPLDEEGEEWEGYTEPARRPWWHWALIALLVAAVAAGIAYLLTGSDLFKGEKDVPSVTGQDVGVATELLESQGFDVDIETRPNAAPRDTVTEQDPIAGETVEEGSTIVLTVSSGPAIVEVPNVAGLSERQARDRLDEAGFEVTTSFRADETVPEDRVVGTEPGERDAAADGRLGHPDRLEGQQPGRGAERGRPRRRVGAVGAERRRPRRQHRPARRRRARRPGRRPEPGGRAAGEAGHPGHDLRLQRRDQRSRHDRRPPEDGGRRTSRRPGSLRRSPSRPSTTPARSAG